MSVLKINNGTTWESIPAIKGEDGQPGADGFSPTATVTQSGSVTTISITDKDGTTSESIDLSDYAPVITDTASGEIASFPDGADGVPVKSLVCDIDPVQDLHGYDSPWPAGGGVNKLNLFTFSPWVSAFGLTTTINNDESISITGTVTESGTQSLQWRILAAPTGFDPTGLTFIGFNLPSGKTIGFRYDPTLNAIVISVASLTQGESVNWKIFLLAYSGSTAPTAWSPYSNICPISGWTGMSVTKTGKNVIDGATLVHHATSIKNGKIGVDSYDDTTPNGSIKLTAGKYTFSVSGANSTNWEGLYFGKEDGTTTALSYNNKSVTFTVQADGFYYFAINIKTEDFVSWDNYDIQLERGETQTAYQEFGDVIPITWEEAGTVYGGTLDVTTGVLRVTHKYYENAGTGNWVEETLGGNRYIIGGVSTDAKNGSTNGWCNIGVLGDATTDNVVVVMSNGRINLCGNIHDAFSSVDTLKAYLEEHPLQLVYELATPLTYQLDPVTVTTLLGDNNIWSNTGDSTVEYCSDTKLYIQKMLS